MRLIESGMQQLEKISTIIDGVQDDIFITCASFEERCLGTLRKFDKYKANRIILFKFKEPNPVREINVDKMDQLFKDSSVTDEYKKIIAEHGISVDGILQLHNYCKSNKLLEFPCRLTITIDITTFSKELLFDTLFYLTNFLKYKRLRLLYTLPEKYASPEEGPLSDGIKNVKVAPFFWNSWSTIKEDLLVVILGYEEMRAWSLVSSFDANVNMIYITKPGSKPEWNTHCEEYNKRLLKENFDVDEIPAMDPVETIRILENQIIETRLYENHNIFIAPLGTKPQVVGTFCFVEKHPDANINIISTTTIKHNTPYYSWGIGETFCTFIEN